MKKKTNGTQDAANVYRTNAIKKIDAPMAQKDSPRAKKTVSSGDLRAPKGR